MVVVLFARRLSIDLENADSTEEIIRRAKEELQKQKDPLQHRHGMDAHYQRRMQERLERQAVSKHGAVVRMIRSIISYGVVLIILDHFCAFANG